LKIHLHPLILKAAIAKKMEKLCMGFMGPAAMEAIGHRN
jgi:hypothetical protein